MAAPQTDRVYTSLLHQLHRPSATILTQPDDLQPSIAYYLAHVRKGQLDGQSPTPLAAAIVSSSLFQFPDQMDVEAISGDGRLETLLKAFRHAVHHKAHTLLRKPDPSNPSASAPSSNPYGVLSSTFSLPPEAELSTWTREVLNGLQGGQSVVRFACLGGLLVGLEDLERQKTVRKAEPNGSQALDETVSVGRHTRGRVEEEVIVALAEVMETYPLPLDDQLAKGGPRLDWESEFVQNASRATGRSAVARLIFVLSSQVLPFVAEDRLRALPLEIFLRSLLGTISSSFRGGKIFQRFPENARGETIGPDSDFSQDLATITSSPGYRSVKSLAELFARATWSFVTAKSQHLWPILNETLLVFEAMTRNLQDGWGRNPWVDAQTEEEIPEPARETLTQTWGALKSFLFVTVMVQQSVVTATTYLPPPSKTASRSDPNLTPASLALVLLRTLSNLSFVITKFGGVTSTARTSVFPQLRRLFYSALDVLSTDRTASERFVTGLCQAEKQDATSPKSSKVMESSKMAFSLACIEQLVPNVDEERIQNHIFAMCTPNLWDHENREVYESSHSVVLALLSAHAQRVGDGSGIVRITETNPNTKPKGKATAVVQPLAETIIPFYTNCLLENSFEGRLISAQLRIAFAALVRSAGSGGTAGGDTLAWFCIQSLLDVLSTLSPHAIPGSSSTAQGDAERVHRLRLMLVSTLPTIPLKLLPRGLEEIRKCIVGESEKGKRGELADEVLKEILERVGDREKVIVMKWWQLNCNSFS